MHHGLVVLGALSLLVAPMCLARQAGDTRTADALEREVLADAQSRASFQQSGLTAGHDGRFFLASDDGNFKLQVGGEIQFRYYASFDADTEDGEDFANGFQLNRTRLDLRGHVLDPKLTYRILTNFNRDGGTCELQDAYAEYELESGLLGAGSRAVCATAVSAVLLNDNSQPRHRHAHAYESIAAKCSG